MLGSVHRLDQVRADREVVAAGQIDLAAIERPTTVEYMDYAALKTGNWLLVSEYARRWGKDGIVSVSAKPGNLNMPMMNSGDREFLAILKRLVLYPTIYGGYTFLHSGLSPEVNESRNGGYIWPWGRQGLPGRPVIQAVADGKANDFWEWRETKCEPFV